MSVRERLFFYSIMIGTLMWRDVANGDAKRALGPAAVALGVIIIYEWVTWYARRRS